MAKHPITTPSFGQEEIDGVARCLASGWVTQGPATSEFESLFRVRHEVEHALATTSCTAALHLATEALGLGPGDEVIVPALTWVTSAHSVEYVGAKVIFADVDPDTFNLDPAAVTAAITPRTRAIVAVHLFGLSADMAALNALAERHGLAVIEDAACAVGSTFQGKPVGGLGTFGCFSFHPRKVITTGEGGMVTTNDAGLADKVGALRNHGATAYLHPESEAERSKPWFMAPFDIVGYNLRLSDIQASVGVAQMAKLNDLLSERKQRALGYHERLKNLGALALPLEPEGYGHTYQSYVIRLLEGGRERRNAIMEVLARAEIQSRPGTHAVHRLGYYRERYDLAAEDFPRACICEDTTITLPIYPGMSDSDQDYIVAHLAEGLGLG